MVREIKKPRLEGGRDVRAFAYSNVDAANYTTPNF